jgi:predicted ATP-grasp superfamily ATP-dependent carboligase
VQVPALVIGVGLNALGVMRSLGRARIPLWNANPQHDYVRSSRWHCPAPVGLEDDQPLAEYLERLPVDRAVLFPASDDRVLEASRLRPSLRERFPVSIAEAGTLDALLDKLSLARLLQERGLPHPRTYAELQEAPDDVFANAFLKPRDSLAFNRRYGVKGVRVSSRADALSRQFEGELVLQEYIPGGADRHYFLDGFAGRDGDIPAMFARRRVRMYPPDFGNSSSMISIALAEIAEAVGALERLLRDLRYRGIFSAEFKHDPRDGLFKLLEVNCRPWWFNGFAADCGVDTALMAYQDALGLPVPQVERYREGVRMAYSFNDLRAVIRTRTPLAQALRFWFGAHDALFARDDPRPFFRYAREQTARMLRGAVRG